MPPASRVGQVWRPGGDWHFGTVTRGRVSRADGGAQLLGKLLDGCGMCGVAGQIGQFARVRVVIVELAALFTSVPFGVAPARRAERVTEETLGFVLEAAAQDLADRPAASRGRRVFEHRDQALPLQVLWRLHVT